MGRSKILAIAIMNQKSSRQIHNQKKKRVTITFDVNLKAFLKQQKSIDGISIGERVESLYRSHRKLVEDISIPKHKRSRGERGKPMYGDAVREYCGVLLTPDAIAFFDQQAKAKSSNRSQVIETAMKALLQIVDENTLYSVSKTLDKLEKEANKLNISASELVEPIHIDSYNLENQINDVNSKGLNS